MSRHPLTGMHRVQLSDAELAELRAVVATIADGVRSIPDVPWFMRSEKQRAYDSTRLTRADVLDGIAAKLAGA